VALMALVGYHGMPPAMLFGCGRHDQYVAAGRAGRLPGWLTAIQAWRPAGHRAARTGGAKSLVQRNAYR
jgi:hypothetical protein